MRISKPLNVLFNFLPLLATAVLLLSIICAAAPVVEPRGNVLSSSSKKGNHKSAQYTNPPSSQKRPGNSGGRNAIPSLADVQDFFKTPGQTAVFWCGKFNKKSVGGRADLYAHSTSLHPPGIVIAELYEDAITKPGWKEEWTGLAKSSGGQAMWNLFSQAFAEGAQGEVHVLWGECPSANGGITWQNIEYPALRRNSKVTKIWKVDASDPSQKTELPK